MNKSLQNKTLPKDWKTANVSVLTYVLRREAAGVVRPSPGVTAGFGEL